MTKKPSILFAGGAILLVVALLASFAFMRGGKSHTASSTSPSYSLSPSGSTSPSLNGVKHAAKAKPKRVTGKTAPYKPGSSLGGRPIRRPSASGLTICSGPNNSLHDAYTFGRYRIFDNAWLESMCLHAVAPGYFRVTSGLSQRNLGTVAAYPNVFTGTHYFEHTPGSPLPMPVSRALSSLFSAGASWSSPTEPSFFLADYDMWVFNQGASVNQHGNYEIVIAVNNIHNHGPLHLIDGHWFHEVSWLTCQRLPGGGCDPHAPAWPILLFASDSSLPTSHLRMGGFLSLLVHQGLVPRSGTVGSVHFGFECWTGCRGAAASVHF